jgi:hypothetical protein
MKKIKKIAWTLPVLAIALFMALQSFQPKEPTVHQIENGFQPTYEWFTHPGGATSETNPANYTYAPSFDPDQTGCDPGSASMCAVKAIRNTSTDKPYLDLNVGSTAVIEGSNVDEILRREE